MDSVDSWKQRDKDGQNAGDKMLAQILIWLAGEIQSITNKGPGAKRPRDLFNINIFVLC